MTPSKIRALNFNNYFLMNRKIQNSIKNIRVINNLTGLTIIFKKID